MSTDAVVETRLNRGGWERLGRTHVSGHFFFREKLYHAQDAAEFLEAQDALADVLPELNGHFSIVQHRSDHTALVCDRIRSVPLFYEATPDGWVATDGLDCPPTGDSCPNALISYLATGAVTGSETLIRGVRQVEAGQIVRLTGHEPEVINYYEHRHCPSHIDEGLLLEQLDAAVMGAMRRLVKSVGGRQIVLFLSGGYDSRLVAVALRAIGYDNVVCVSYGSEGDKQVVAAKDVAARLGFPWHRLAVSKNLIRERLADPSFARFLDRAESGVAAPYLMGVLALVARDQVQLAEDCVFVTGSTGDLLEGDQIDAMLKQDRHYQLGEVVDAILRRHYFLMGLRVGSLAVHRRRILALMERAGRRREVYSREEALDVTEWFNWRERQAKYVVQDARCYELLAGADWRLPLWDHEFMDFWLTVPDELRIGRRLYHRYVEAEQYKTANNPSLAQRLRHGLKRPLAPIYRAFYPLEKVRTYLFGDSPWWAFSVGGYLRVLRLTRGWQTSTVTSQVAYHLAVRHRLGFGGLRELVLRAEQGPEILETCPECAAQARS